MSWFLTILFLTLTIGTNLSEAKHENKKLHPSPVVVGTVFCDTCFQQTFSQESRFISGASIAVECKLGKTKQRFYKEVKTNEQGEFKVKLPFLVRKNVKRLKGCNFKLLSSNVPNCAIASTSTSFSPSLKKKMQDEHIFSAGFFSFKPIKKPKFCDQNKPKKNEVEDFFFFPPNPLNPPLVPNPFQPPLIPNPFTPPPLIPNPFQPPSPPLIPNPFQPPSPPPFLPNPFQPPPSSPPPLIPNPFQPPPSSPPPFSLFPPIVVPGITPSPPPPPPPPKSILPFPFPPLFPPPHNPGSPPTSSTKSSP
ncbi:formin-like protein 20 [Vicia villosa]|uniref:formin-like protein 20 n=1 Tax=Vicia villosa TaxID=3911 RepID=UPI00273CE45D|nr:formin-like protein 20 [Vicia villosa]